MKIKITFSKREADFLTKEFPNPEIDYYTVEEIDEDVLDKLSDDCIDIEVNECQTMPTTERCARAGSLYNTMFDAFEEHYNKDNALNFE